MQNCYQLDLFAASLLSMMGTGAMKWPIIQTASSHGRPISKSILRTVNGLESNTWWVRWRLVGRVGDLSPDTLSTLS